MKKELVKLSSAANSGAVVEDPAQKQRMDSLIVNSRKLEGKLKEVMTVTKKLDESRRAANEKIKGLEKQNKLMKELLQSNNIEFDDDESEMEIKEEVSLDYTYLIESHEKEKTDLSAEYERKISTLQLELAEYKEKFTKNEEKTRELMKKAEEVFSVEERITQLETNVLMKTEAIHALNNELDQAMKNNSNLKFQIENLIKEQSGSSDFNKEFLGQDSPQKHSHQLVTHIEDIQNLLVDLMTFVEDETRGLKEIATLELSNFYELINDKYLELKEKKEVAMKGVEEELSSSGILVETLSKDLEKEIQRVQVLLEEKQVINAELMKEKDSLMKIVSEFEALKAHNNQVEEQMKAMQLEKQNIDNILTLTTEAHSTDQVSLLKQEIAMLKEKIVFLEDEKQISLREIEEKTKEYEKAKKDLDQLLFEVSTKSWDKTKEEYEQSRSELQQRLDEKIDLLVEMKQDIMAKEAKIEELEGRLFVQTENNQLTDNIKLELSKTMEECGVEVFNEDLSLKSLVEQYRFEREEKERLLQISKQAEEQLTSLAEQNYSLADEKEVLVKRIASLQETDGKEKEDMQNLMEEIALLKAELQEKESLLIQERDLVANEKADLSSALEGKNEQIVLLQHRLKEFEERLTVLKEEREAEIREFKSQIMEQNLDDLMAEKDSKILALEQEINNLKRIQCDEIDEKNRILQTEIEELKCELETVKIEKEETLMRVQNDHKIIESEWKAQKEKLDSELSELAEQIKVLQEENNSKRLEESAAEDIKAEKEALNERIESLLIDLDSKKREFESHLCDCRNEITALQQEKESLSKEIERKEQTLTERIKILESDIVEKEANLENSIKERVVLNQQMNGMSETIEQLQKSSEINESKLMEENRKFSEELPVLQEQLASMKNEVAEAVKDRNELQSLYDSLVGENEKLLGEREVKSMEIEKLASELIVKTQKLDSLNQELESSSVKLAVLQQECSSLSQQLFNFNTLQASFMEKESIIGELEKEMNSKQVELEKQREQFEAEKQSLQSQISMLEEAQASYKKSLSLYENAQNEEESEKESLRREMEKLKQEVSGLKEQADKFVKLSSEYSDLQDKMALIVEDSKIREDQLKILNKTLRDEVRKLEKEKSSNSSDQISHEYLRHVVLKFLQHPEQRVSIFT